MSAGKDGILGAVEPPAQTPEAKAAAEAAATAAAKVEADKLAAETPEQKAAREAAAKAPPAETPEAKLAREAAEAAAKKAPVLEAPVEFKDFVLPEGAQVDQAALAEFKTLAKDLKLDQAGAQKLVDLQAKLVKGAGEAIAAQHQKNQEEWAAALPKDAEFGGEKFEENTAIIRRGVKTFATPELAAWIKHNGLGNYPEMARLFFRIGKLVGEDGTIVGQAPNTPAKTAAQRLFPSMPNP